MPPAQFHIQKAERNERFYQSCNLGNSSFKEWATVAIFYAALHYVDALLENQASIHPKNHKDREAAISKISQFRQIAPHYLYLYDRSRDARYTDMLFTDAFFSDILTNQFCPVRTHLRSTLNLPP